MSIIILSTLLGTRMDLSSQSIFREIPSRSTSNCDLQFLTRIDSNRLAKQTFSSKMKDPSVL